MKNRITQATSRLLAAAVVGWLAWPGLHAAEISWQEETALITPQDDQTVVRPVHSEKVLYQNADPQLAIEWALANRRTAVVLPGQYVVGESIDIPRDDVTLIIAPGAEISLNPTTEHKTDIGFRPAGSHHLIPLIFNHRHDRVRLVHLGKLVHSSWPDQKPAKQTFPIVFDGRNPERTCGIDGGLLVVAGYAAQSILLLDARNVQVPLVLLDTDARLDGVLTLEGCERCRLGMIVNLSPDPGGKTGETVDLNSSNRDIHIERLIGERSQEIIDSNASHVNVQELVSIGSPQKLLCFVVGSGPRWTSRPRAANRIDVWKASVLEDATRVRRIIAVPNLPDALPRFTVQATVAVTLQDGRIRQFSKAVAVDVRRGK